LPSFSRTLVIRVGPEALWALVGDARRLAALFPYMTIDEYVEEAPERCTFRRQLTLPGTTDLCWREENCRAGARVLVFRALDGDLPSLAGRWTVEEDGDAARLTLAVDFEIPPALASKIPAPLAQYVIAQLFQAMCERIKTRLEDAPA
jgi:ribosome-associated toxin RatA of RatAB toxin-antitoxin module